MKHKEVINSKDRITGGTSSNFTVKLGKAYSNVKSIELIGYHVANTIYTINTNNQNLRYIENTGANTINVVIPNKNYSASQLATELSTLMTANTANSITYTVTYDQQTMKFTFTASTNNFYLHFDGVNNNCHLELGFDSSYIGSSSSTVSSVNIIRLDKRFLLMETDLLNDLNTGPNGKGQCSFILQLPDAGTSQFYSMEVLKHELKHGRNQFDRFKIALKDFDNNIIPLNGSDNVFIFEITI